MKLTEQTGKVPEYMVTGSEAWKRMVEAEARGIYVKVIAGIGKAAEELDIHAAQTGQPRQQEFPVTGTGTRVEGSK